MAPLASSFWWALHSPKRGDIKLICNPDLSYLILGPKRKPNKSLAFHQHSPKPTPSLSPWKKLKNPARRGANLGAAQIKWTGDDDQRLISLAEAQKKELGVHDWEALVGHFKRRTACALSQRWHKTLRPKSAHEVPILKNGENC